MKLFVHLKFTSVLILSIVLLSSYMPPVRSRDARSWEHLGTRKVNFGLDRDEIQVRATEGTFSKLRIKVTNGNLNMHKMVVVYGNGMRDEILLRYNFSKGTPSRVIDLRGGNRVIKKVIFWYDTKNVSRGRATIHLFGR